MGVCGSEGCDEEEEDGMMGSEGCIEVFALLVWRLGKDLKQLVCMASSNVGEREMLRYPIGNIFWRFTSLPAS